MSRETTLMLERIWQVDMMAAGIPYSLFWSQIRDDYYYIIYGICTTVSVSLVVYLYKLLYII